MNWSNTWQADQILNKLLKYLKTIKTNWSDTRLHNKLLPAAELNSQKSIT